MGSIRSGWRQSNVSSKLDPLQRGQMSSVSAQIQSTVKSRYSFEGQVICPISRLNIAQTGETVDLSHIVPKYLRNHYGRGVLDGADNIIPTFPAIHKQVELHQHRPLLSFEFLREDDDDYDLYHL